MTFAALAGWQAWALIAGAVTVAVALFLIRLKPPRTVVPSLLLWRRVLDNPRELTLWERIRRAVSLVLTALIALLLAFAVARPARVAAPSDGSSPRMLIVIDSSWSMQARTSSGERRWDRAVAEARRLLSSAPGGEVAVGTTADGLVEGPTTDTALLEGALDGIVPAGSDATAWPHLAGAVVHFITDGATPRITAPGVVVHSVFEAAPNVAITALHVRPSLTGDRAADAYLEIANYATVPQSVQVTLARGAGVIFDRPLEVGPSGILRQVVPLSRGGDAVLRARIAAPANALDIDDEAVAWIERATPLSITVIGGETSWLRAAFERDPEVRARFIEPAAYAGPPTSRGTEEDLLIFDGWAPPERPDRPALLFAPPPSTEWLSEGTVDGGRPVVPQEERRPRWDVPGAHRVVQGVDPFTLVIDRARAYSAAGLVPVAQSLRGTPLVYVSEAPGARLVLVTFGTHESNLAGAPGFPVLLANALDWLARPAGDNRTTGLVTLPGEVVTLKDPAGNPIPIVHVGNSTTGILRVPGIHVAEGAGPRRMIAVNAGEPGVSNLTWSSLQASEHARTVPPGGSSRPWWIYCALAAFALALVEWWTWQRRITV